MQWKAALAFALAIPGLLAQANWLVQIDVSARDAHGRPVNGLRAEDIRVFDNGKLQQAWFFHPWQTQKQKPISAGAGEFANRGGVERPVTVVVLDFVDPSVESVQVTETLHAMEKFEGSDDLYLYSLDAHSGTMFPIHALPATEAQANAKPEDWVEGLGAAALLRQQRSPADVANRADPMVGASAAASALESLAAKMARLPGRKSLVWIGKLPLLARSSDWGTDAAGREMAARVAGLAAMLDQAETSLEVVRTTATAQATSSPDAIVMIRPDDRPQMPNLSSGRVYLDQIERAIADAAVDNRQGYRIWFQPDGGGTDVQFHKLKLESEWRGIELHSKQGYQGPVPAPKTTREIVADLTLALRDDPEIGLRALVSPTKSDDRKLHFDLTLNPADLMFTPRRNGAAAKLAVQVIEFTGDGRALSGGDPKSIDISSLAHTDLPVDVTVNSSTRKVRVIVCDENTGLAGSLTLNMSDLGARQ